MGALFGFIRQVTFANAAMNLLFPYNAKNSLTSRLLSACQEAICALEGTCILCCFCSCPVGHCHTTVININWMAFYSYFSQYCRIVFLQSGTHFVPQADYVKCYPPLPPPSCHLYYQTGRCCGNLNSAVLPIREHRVLIPAVLEAFSSFLPIAVDIYRYVLQIDPRSIFAHTVW